MHAGRDGLQMTNHNKGIDMSYVYLNKPDATDRSHGRAPRRAMRTSRLAVGVLCALFVCAGVTHADDAGIAKPGAPLLVKVGLRYGRTKTSPQKNRR